MQTGAALWAWVKRTPRDARASIFGEQAKDEPIQPRVSVRWESVVIKRILYFNPEPSFARRFYLSFFVR
jgi:hypothetical protein